MPVVGHAFVGLAVARCTQPKGAGAAVLAFWPPLIVTLSYLPDVLTQAGELLGVGNLRVPAHSLPFALLVAVPIGWGLAALSPGLSPWRGWWLAWLTIAGHDLLDAFQSTDRLPFWPLQRTPLGGHWQVIPVEPQREAMLFGIAFMIFLTVSNRLSPLATSKESGATPASSRGRAAVIAAHGCVIVLLLAAMGTHIMRALRDRELLQAKHCIERGEYDGALGWLQLTERFPSTARAGQIDYLRAVCWQELGQRAQAEEYYLASYRTDPWYIWCVGDLGVFYADAPLPVEERRRLAEPLLNRLKTDFAGMPDAHRMIVRIERKLGTPPPLPATSPALMPSTEPAATNSP